MSKDCAAFVRIGRGNAPVQTHPGLARTVKSGILVGSESEEENIDGL